MAKPMGMKDHVALVGGVAKNEGIRKALEQELNLTLFVPDEPQITGALSTTIIAGNR